MANAQQANANIVLPSLPVPFSVSWGHAEIFKINRQIEKIQLDLEDIRPCMIRKRPQNQARKNFLMARRRQIMTALGL